MGQNKLFKSEVISHSGGLFFTKTQLKCEVLPPNNTSWSFPIELLLRSDVLTMSDSNVSLSFRHGGDSDLEFSRDVSDNPFLSCDEKVKKMFRMSNRQHLIIIMD